MEKRNIIITYILLLFIIAILLIMVFYYKGKASKTCPKCEVNNTTTMNNNQNNNIKKEDNKEDIISTGKTLWNNTYNLYWNFMKNMKTTEISLGKNKINNIKDFNFSSLTSNALNEMYSSLGVKNDNGNYYIESIRTNGDITYMISEITLKENKDNKIIYNVESKYCASGDKSNCKDVASVNNDFIIIKENNNYKVDSFILPD